VIALEVFGPNRQAARRRRRVPASALLDMSSLAPPVLYVVAMVKTNISCVA